MQQRQPPVCSRCGAREPRQLLLQVRSTAAWTAKLLRLRAVPVETRASSHFNSCAAARSQCTNGVGKQCGLPCEQKRKGNLSILTYRSAGG